MAAIARVMPKDAIVVEEAPSHRNALHDYLPIRTSGGFYTEASGGLGWALPGAIGVALAEPRRKVICIVGDGAALYSIQALWNAAQLKLPITFVVFNNRGYAALKAFCEALQISGAPGHEVPGMNFVEVARGFGCDAKSVTRAAELVSDLEKAFLSKDPVLLDVLLDTAYKPLY
jgi:benzoylformate decarboxylase